jgi:hypothetical protein
LVGVRVAQQGMFIVHYATTLTLTERDRIDSGGSSYEVIALPATLSAEPMRWAVCVRTK